MLFRRTDIYHVENASLLVMKLVYRGSRYSAYPFPEERYVVS